MLRSIWILAMGALLAGTAGCVGCADGDDSGTNDNFNTNNNTNNNQNTGDDTIYQLQDESRADFIPTEAEVNIEGVIVTAVDTYGDRTGNVWVEEPDGGPFSGVLVYGPTIVSGSLQSLAIGDIVNVTGIKDEFALQGQDPTGRTMTEIKDGTIEKVASGQPVEPVEVSSPEEIMSDPGGEKYEGVLVVVRNVRSTGVNSYGEHTFTGGLIVGDELMDVGSVVTEGTCYARVVGVVNYFFKYVLLPRSAEDFEVAANDADCEAAPTEDCTDGVDNDGDGHTDCDDWDCSEDPSCRETACDDGQDNDGDGFTDCQDKDCRAQGGCVENTPDLCSDSQDNDGDGLTDCDDPGCRLQPAVLAAGTCDQEETGDDACGDSVDNDNDGFTDCEDWSCLYNPDVTVCEDAQEDTQAECTDSVDNDNDSYTDCQDFSCQYAGVCADVESTDAQCSDNADNDNDGFTDCEDWSCQKSMVVTVCEGSILTCSDGVDNDGNGFADCDDFACRYCDPNDPTKNKVSPVCPPCE